MSMDESLVCDHSNESYCHEQYMYFHVILFIMLYKVILTFKWMKPYIACDQSNESY